jgi:hypothetical protein
MRLYVPLLVSKLEQGYPFYHSNIVLEILPVIQGKKNILTNTNWKLRVVACICNTGNSGGEGGLGVSDQLEQR